MIDNPCWGGSETEQHDLQHLLHQINSGYFSGTITTAVTADVTGPSQITTTTSSASTLINGQYRNDDRDNDYHRHRNPSLIVYNDANYLVLNKPADLRMDGHHPSTVHKLLTYWYPPPSLVHLISNSSKSNTNNNNNNNTTSDDNDSNDSNKDDDTTENFPHPKQKQKQKQQQQRQAKDVKLLERTSKLSKHNDLHDNTLRPTHQLDYATSGVLLLGKNKRAAGVACRAFHDRTVRKEYLAIVHGHVLPEHMGRTYAGNGAGNVLTEEEMTVWRGWTDGSMEADRRKRRRKLGTMTDGRRGAVRTFPGFMPVHSVFAKWKALRVKRKKHRATAHHGGDNGLTTVYLCPLDRMLLEADPSTARPSENCDRDQDHLLTLHWRDIKKDSTRRAFFEELSTRYNLQLESASTPTTTVPTATSSTTTVDESNNEKRTEECGGGGSKTDAVLPAIFRIEGEDPNAVYVHAPLAEVPGEFRVVADREAIIEGTCNGDAAATNKDGGIPEDILSRYCALSNHPSSSSSCGGKEEAVKLEFRPALTRCLVLGRGEWNGRLVSKVLLQPKTGRR